MESSATVGEDLKNATIVLKTAQQVEYGNETQQWVRQSIDRWFYFMCCHWEDQ